MPTRRRAGRPRAARVCGQGDSAHGRWASARQAPCIRQVPGVDRPPHAPARSHCPPTPVADTSPPRAWRPPTEPGWRPKPEVGLPGGEEARGEGWELGTRSPDGGYLSEEEWPCLPPCARLELRLRGGGGARQWGARRGRDAGGGWDGEQADESECGGGLRRDGRVRGGGGRLGE